MGEEEGGDSGGGSKQPVVSEVPHKQVDLNTEFTEDTKKRKKDELERRAKT